MVDPNNVWIPDIDDSQITRKLVVLTLDTDDSDASDEDIGFDPYNSGTEKAVRRSAARWRQ